MHPVLLRGLMGDDGDLAGLIPDATMQRLRQARAGVPVARMLRLADVQPGDVGVIEATVVAVAPQRTYERKRGGQGTMCRATLSDGSADLDLVLWDEETAHAGRTLVAGARVRLAGATAKAGYRGGVELSLGAARVTALAEAASPEGELEGLLVEIGPTRIRGERPQETFQADVLLQLSNGAPARVALSGEALLAARRLAVGSRVSLHGVAAHPALDGWWLASPAATCRPAGA